MMGGMGSKVNTHTHTQNKQTNPQLLRGQGQPEQPCNGNNTTWIVILRQKETEEEKNCCNLSEKKKNSVPFL